MIEYIMHAAAVMKPVQHTRYLAPMRITIEVDGDDGQILDWISFHAKSTVKGEVVFFSLLFYTLYYPFRDTAVGYCGCRN